MMKSPQRPGAMLISFSGIDGTGKSTQIANLQARLLDAGLTVQLVTFWDDVARMKGMRENLSHTLFRGDKGVGTPEAPIVRRDKNVRSPLMSLFRMALYVIDAFSLRHKVDRAMRSGGDVVIFDRYLYDELANLNLKNRFIQIYIRAVMKLVPKPDVSFFLDANPIQALARKPEYPLEFLHSNRNAYLKLSQFLGGITVVPSMPLDDVKLHVVQSVLGSAA